jgi:hypothetical protein
MATHSRELLLTTKTARQWQDTFDQQVDAIIDTINRVDTVNEIARTTEIMDVYHHTSVHTTTQSRRRARMLFGDRPFEFLSFCN